MIVPRNFRDTTRQIKIWIGYLAEGVLVTCNL